MKTQHYVIKGIAIALALGGVAANAQIEINTWRGDDAGAAWSDRYKWKLSHTPTGEEAVHFRGENSLIRVNSTVQLNNGMLLYGQELSLQGNGNINLWSKVPHQRTVTIPASAGGFANLTLNDNLSLNGRVALSAKEFGTSASKGSITLKDRSNVTGDLCIGHAGVGTGQVYVKDNATYRVTGLQLQTEAQQGGSAEIHIQGGTVRVETKNNPFDIFLADTSRKVIIGDGGTLRFEYEMPVGQKKDALKQLIAQDHIVAAPDCRLAPPIIQEKMVILRAVDERDASEYQTKEQILAMIDEVATGSAAVASQNAQPQKLESLLKNMRATNPAMAETNALDSRVVAAPSAPIAPSAPAAPSVGDGGKVVSYMAFFGVVMLALRRVKRVEPDPDEQ